METRKISSAQDAIKLAIDGGYDHFIPSDFHLNEHFTFMADDIAQIMLDPLFWKALGKARGWDKNEITINCPARETSRVSKTGTMTYHVPAHTRKRTYALKPEKIALKWFETRLSNGDETKFWQSLP